MRAKLPTVVSQPSPNSNLRILFISRAHGLNAGGMERLSHHILSEYQQNPRITVHALVHRPVTHRSLFIHRLSSLCFTLSLIPRALFLARTVDAVHLGDPVLALIGRLIQLVWHKPIAVTVHGLDITYPHAIYQSYLRSFFTQFNAYFPISTHTAKLLQSFNLTGSVTIIQPGTDDWFTPHEYTHSDLSQFLGRSITNQVILLTIGRLVPRKGHLWFIQKVLPSLPPHTLYVIAGIGPEYSTLRVYLDQHPEISQQVCLSGRVSDQNLRLLYNTADAFIEPNISTQNDSEGFGLVLLEAAMCGLPVFAADLEGIRDAITPNQNGTLLPSAQAQIWIDTLFGFINHPYKNSHARKYTLTHFNWSYVSNKYIHALKQIVKK